MARRVREKDYDDIHMISIYTYRKDYILYSYNMDRYLIYIEIL